MEPVEAGGAWADLAAGVSAWWAGAGLPDPDLPPPPDPAVVVVIGTVVGGLGLAALATGWVERRLSWAGLFAAAVGLGLLLWAWDADRGAGPGLIPEAFVEVVARILR